MSEQGYKDFAERIEHVCAQYAKKTAIVYMRNDGSKTEFTYGGILERIRAIKSKIAEAGLSPGDRVAVIAPHSPYVILTGFALAYSNMTSVLIDAALPMQEINRLLEFSDVRAVFSTSLVFDCIDKALTTEIPVFNITTIVAHLEMLKGSAMIAQKNSTVDPHLDVIAILYSSGTTASVKGIMITYTAVIKSRELYSINTKLKPDMTYLLVLPFNHVAGYANAFQWLLTGCEIGLIEDVDAPKLAKGLTAYKPVYFGMVPRVLEVIENKIRHGIHEKGKRTERSVLRLLAISGFLRKNFGINVGKKIFSKITDTVFGENIFGIGVGATPAKESTECFYQNLGINWANFYGLTETFVPTTGTGLPDGYHFGTEGNVKRHPGIDIKIHNPDESGIGEILVKTILIMKGYFRDPELTAAAFDEDGYFKTGDLGYIDKKDYLHVTGRIKETILLHTGKKVAPSDVDNLYGSVCPNAMLASCGVPGKDEDFDEIHIFIETGTHTADELETIKNDIADYSAQTSTLFKASGIHFLDKLPVTSIGKVKRYHLKEIVIAKRETNQESVEYMPQRAPKVLGRRLEDNVLNVIKKHSGNQPITLDSHLQNELGFDSLTMLEVCVELESMFSVSISENLGAVETVHDIVALIKEGGRTIKGEQLYNIEDYPLKKTKKHIRQLKRYMWLSRRAWKLKVSGLDNIPADRQYILCPNHQSHFDGLWVWTAIRKKGVDLRKIGCLAKQEHTLKKSSNQFMTLLGGIPVDRRGNTIPAMKRALSCIQDGYSILIHPEGTRTIDGKLQEFKGGAAKLSIDTGVDIIPVRIDGAWDIFPPHRKRPKVFRIGGRYPISISFGKPIKPDGKSVEELTAQIQREVERMGDLR